MKNYYELLGIQRDATGREIRSAYLKKIKSAHPDSTDTTDRNFNSSASDINEAYQTLKDPRRKSSYDLKLDTEITYFDRTAYFEQPEIFTFDNEGRYRAVLIILWIALSVILVFLIITVYSSTIAPNDAALNENMIPEEFNQNNENLPTPNLEPKPNEIEIIREI